MKKFIKFFVVSIMILPFALSGETTSNYGETSVGSVAVTAVPATPATPKSVTLFPSPLSAGATGSSVTDLQTILKTDPNIYPEGLVTGYYGQLTESAVKRLQQKYGIPVTGVIDQDTIQVIYPTSLSLAIISPNGGEVWDKNRIQTILWKSSVSPITTLKHSTPVTTPGATNGSAPATTVMPEPAPPIVRPFFTQVSLTLIKDSNPNLKYHIGTADVYQSSYSWKIPAFIPEAKDYRVRISAGGEVPCLYRMEAQGTTQNSMIAPHPCPMAYPQHSASDTSDATFAITGTGNGGGTDPEVVAKMKAVITEMEQTLNNLLKQIQSLKSLLGNL